MLIGAIGVGVAAFGAGKVVEGVTAYMATPKKEKKPWFTSRNFYDGPFESPMTVRFFLICNLQYAICNMMEFFHFEL